MRRCHSVFALLLTSLALGLSSAQAAVTLYADYAAWSSAVAGETTLAIPDPSPTNYITFGQGDANVTYGGIAFSTSAALGDRFFYNIGPVFSSNPAVLSSQGAGTGVANILVTLPGPVSGIALSYGTFDASYVTFTLSNGHAVSLGSAVRSGYTTPDFFGVTDSTPFTTLLITTPDYVLNINNISVPAAIPEAAIPEPASLVLLAGGVIGLGLTRRKCKMAAPSA